MKKALDLTPDLAPGMENMITRRMGVPAGKPTLMTRTKNQFPWWVYVPGMARTKVGGQFLYVSAHTGIFKIYDAQENVIAIVS